MNTEIGDLRIELSVDTILIREVKTGRLMKAKTVRASEAVDEYHALVKKLKAIHIERVAKERAQRS